MRVHGRLEVPGDKSISHRALILGALSHGVTRVRGLLDSADVRSTAGVLRALGVSIDADGSDVVVTGGGPDRLRAPMADLDAGNSGTTARLMAGVLASRPFTSRVIGDASLSRRPMGRITRPLAAMGATLTCEEGDGLPMTVTGGALRGLAWQNDKASAQVKSAILLAGFCGGVPVEIREPVPSRDHTERMMRRRGVDVTTDGGTVTLRPGARSMPAMDVAVPGDPSSAAFFAVLAGFATGGELELAGVCANPGRTGAFRVLDRMGVSVSWEDLHESGGEPVATVIAAPRTLRGTIIEPAEVPALIDELPAIACLAARAPGETRVTGASELRVKESDRIALVVRNLRSVGAQAEELADGFVVHGTNAPLAGHVETRGDHRIAMAFGVLGAGSGGRITVDDPACVAVSYPSFWADLANACA